MRPIKYYIQTITICFILTISFFTCLSCLSTNCPAIIHVEDYGYDANALITALSFNEDVSIGSGVTIDLGSTIVTINNTDIRIYGNGNSVIRGHLEFGDYDHCRNISIEHIRLCGSNNTGPVLTMAQNASGHAAYECSIRNCIVRGSINIGNTVMFTIENTKSQNEDPNGYSIYANAGSYINSLNIINSRFLGRVYINALGAVNMTNSIFESEVDPIVDIRRACGGSITGCHFESWSSGVTCLKLQKWTYGLNVSGNILSVEVNSDTHFRCSGRSIVIGGNQYTNSTDTVPSLILTSDSTFCDVLTNYGGHGWLIKVQNDGSYNQVRKAQ